MLNPIIDIKNELGNTFAFTEVSQLGPLISRIIGVIIAISAILFLLYFIWGGIQWITSGGEKTAVMTAKQRITAAIIGLILVLASWTIFTLVKYLFGIPPTQSKLTPKAQPSPKVEEYICPSGDRPSQDTCVGWWECRDRYGEGWYCETFKEQRGDVSWGWCCPSK